MLILAKPLRPEIFLMKDDPHDPFVRDTDHVIFNLGCFTTNRDKHQFCLRLCKWLLESSGLSVYGLHSRLIYYFLVFTTEKMGNIS